MSNENNNVNKDVANSLSKYSDYGHKGTNIVLDAANSINNWYAEQLEKMSEGEIPVTRLETNVDNTVGEVEQENLIIETDKIETKVNEYTEIQTNNKNKVNIINNNRIKTQLDENVEFSDKINSATNEKKAKLTKKISTTIKGVKLLNNVANKVIQSGKSINTGLNESGLKSFENGSSRIMTEPIRKTAKKVTTKATNKLKKETKKFVKNNGKKVVKGVIDGSIKAMKLIAKLIVEATKTILSMLPSLIPIIIIILIIVAFCSFFGIGMSEDTKKNYEKYMISTQDEYDKQTVGYYEKGNIVEGAIEGRGMINWKAPLAIIQILNGKLNYDKAEQDLLNAFKKAELYEKIIEEKYTYEKTIEQTDARGNVTKKIEKVTEVKKIVKNPSIDDYINWCNSNFSIINNYKRSKRVKYNPSQTKFTDSEIEQIKILYNSNSFFELFSDTFKNKYSYLTVSIGDEQLQAIYNEFLNNVGTRYLMDHSNLSYDKCMDYYDCSSWVIHCLAHCKIKKIPNTGARGIYNDHCYPININDRKAGDLIFLKDTYNTGQPGSISHIGIYMGELTINGETDEWIIDTGGNPSGVRIRKYKNGWWNGSNFYGFGRLK